MCSRYTIIGTAIFAERFSHPFLRPRYNAAPGQNLPVITEHGLREAGFGIIRHDGRRLINQRIERVREKGISGSDPCLIPASGFYEWKSEGARRQPYYFSLPGRELFCFAGVLDTAGDAFAIVTRQATDPVSRIHPRMPFILDAWSEEEWLRGREPEPAPDLITMIAVSLDINDPAAPDDPALIRPAFHNHTWW
ncbi:MULTISPECIES: SOS response-associated peptidase [Methanocalculus]|uniref:SOS response-associated peptidase n=1 Tax=Methanocalculus TaxID=71151 RepID=UPI00209E89AF|nr:SOS response-associated peptidase [Methanocalculus sp. MSAO_Arc1]MCP1661471.1 putative SOS response-associated peptidase YedK [Methanocalculus sp. AMF5]